MSVVLPGEILLLLILIVSVMVHKQPSITYKFFIAKPNKYGQM